MKLQKSTMSEEFTLRASHSVSNKTSQKEKSVSCIFYQKGICHQKADHENSGQLYLHVYSTCFGFVKMLVK